MLRGGLFRLGHRRFGHVHFLRRAPGSQPVERGADFLFLGILGWAGAERDQVTAVVVVGEAVLEAVGAVAFVAEHTGDERGVDEGLAGWICALLLVGEDVGFGGEGSGACWALGSGGAGAGPFAGFGTFVGGLGAVVEAEFAGGRRRVSEVVLIGWWWCVSGRRALSLPFTTFAAEGEEV